VERQDTFTAVFTERISAKKNNETSEQQLYITAKNSEYPLAVSLEFLCRTWQYWSNSRELTIA
jgi:hypothetical protein